jgi:endonuclease/exonuclease/phosphatase family metal-dependent hydrolase
MSSHEPFFQNSENALLVWERSFSRRIRVALYLFLIILFVVPANAGNKHNFRFAKPVKVITRNVYVGADIFTLMSGDPANPLRIPMNVAALIQAVSETDFFERAEALAAEIDMLRPDLIGLQEVSLIRTQSPGDFLLGNPEPAENVLYDYLTILMDALQSRGLNYEVAAVIKNADVELPMLAGFDGEIPLLDDARLTDRDVVLKRKGVKTSNITARNFNNNFQIVVGTNPDNSSILVEFTRGFIALDAKVRGKSYRFVNTHLEVMGQGYEVIQSLQAEELLAELDAEILPTILVGDFNSSPEDPDTQPYSLITQAGFEDIWTIKLGNDDPGHTCCQEANLLNEASLLDERIDLIFVRNDFGFLPFSIIGPAFATVVGDEQGEKTPSGMWPSDHAGVFAWLWLPYLRNIHQQWSFSLPE